MRVMISHAKWQTYNAGADMEAINWLMNQGGKDTKSGTDTNIRQMASSVSPVNINMGTLVGSFEHVAQICHHLLSPSLNAEHCGELREVATRQVCHHRGHTGCAVRRAW